MKYETIRIKDTILHRKAKSRAAMEGLTLIELTEKLLLEYVKTKPSPKS